MQNKFFKFKFLKIYYNFKFPKMRTSKNMPLPGGLEEIWYVVCRKSIALVYTLTKFLAQLALVSFSVLQWFMMQHQKLEGLVVMQSFLPYVNDLQAFSSSICLLFQIFQSKLRLYYFTLYRIRRGVVETTPVYGD